MAESSGAELATESTIQRCANSGSGEETDYVDRSISEPNKKNSLIRKMVEILLAEWESQSKGEGKIIDFHMPDELKKLFKLELLEAGTPDEELLPICRSIVDLSLHAGHPGYFNQLWGGLDEYGLLSAWMVEALHTSVYTYEVAPLFSLMEQYIVRYVGGEIVGFPEVDKVDGLFNPGGSLSNILGMHLARYNLNSSVKTKGNNVFEKPLVILTSEESHYSLQKGASVLGIGTDYVWKVATDTSGRMLPQKLEERIAEAKTTGLTPLLVSATSGTTVLGAYDPIEEIAEICERNGIWLHVDAAWGGAAMLSSKLRPLVKGIERADSVIWNPHKMLGLPLQCAMFLTRHKHLLLECNSNKSSYLFQTDKPYDSEYDIGDKTFLCGRKNDALKFWLTWKARGKFALTAAVENAFDMAEYFANLIRDREGFHLVLPKVQCTNVCFWYIPPKLRKHVDWNSESFKEALGKVAPALKRRMLDQGTIFIGYQPIEHRKLPNFFRLVVHCNPQPTRESMLYVVTEFERLGADF
ncbi:Acidic amino acid decarboxylase GADL1 [Hypsibius exemplaris]|uniref:Acidic amino acid decarboxylase GADL1 n=1 Tax=Hypsibius exemplaris TaxID=2072580 RepID=A0A1W0WI03_HYPEX|nr:Acidic amino acid decarboxylase GADL1 [Hypsibius exemplaris]